MKYIRGILFVSLLPASFYGRAETGISRSVFTTGVINREPVSEFEKISTENTRVYFFTEFPGLKGRTITHRWEYNGEVLAEI